MSRPVRPAGERRQAQRGGTSSSPPGRPEAVTRRPANEAASDPGSTRASDNAPASAAPVDAVVAKVRQVYRGWNRATSVAQMRSDWDALFAADDAAPAAASFEPTTVAGVPAAWLAAPGARTDKVVLYLHGGGFQVGSTASHRELMAGISAAAGCRVLGVDYRRAPEHRHPAALDDATAVCEALLARGFAPADLAFAGDSAGAGLAVSALLARRDAGRPLPAAAVLMSAWTDLTASGASYETRAASDPIHQRPMIVAMARNYLGADGDPHDPRVSPLFAALDGLPPLLVQVGDRETVLSDSTGFADRARAAGVVVELEVWEDMIHVFQQFPRELVEAREALGSIGAFLRTHLRIAAAPADRAAPSNAGDERP